jgi:hypothetical protein
VLARARETCERARAAAPDWAGSHEMLSFLWNMEAEWKLVHGADPSEAVERGRADFRRAVAIDRRLESAWHSAGELELIAARWAIHQQRSPEAAFAAARKDLEAAVEASRAGGSLPRLAELYRRRAEWRAAHKQPIDEDVSAGLERAAEALRINPKSGSANLQFAALHLVRARATPVGARAEALAKARTELDAALRLDPNLAEEARPLGDEIQRLQPTASP